MKKGVSILVAMALVFSLVAGIRAPSASASGPTNPRELIQKYISEHLNVPAVSDKKDNLKISSELIDGVEIPTDLIESKKLKSGEDYVKVAIDGVKKTALDFARENNISINSPTLDPVDRTKIVNYIETLKSEHDAIKSQIAGLSVTVENDLYVAYNGVIIETQIKNIKDLYARFRQERVHIETIYTINLNYSVPLINADDVWTDPGVDGTDMYVGVIDTGVDYTHPDLGGSWGVKVVAGWDFGDDDSNPMDCNGHGTHVSGIMTADGTLKGVAPKAKIVIGKIVSGCEGSASSTDIAAAFDYMADPYNLDSGEEGTHPPVAAVNMSFGSQAGFVTADEPEQVAIENCIATGIFVSLSAGNSYWSYYPYGYYPWYPDFSLVGSPSVTPSAISVAASYNSYSKYPALTKVAPSPVADYAYTVGSGSSDPISTLGDNGGAGYSYVNCGYGNTSEFPGGGISGKIALIRRGTYSFLIKVQNAYNAGAIGVIIYNNTSGYVNMNTDGQPSIPAVFVSASDGTALLQYAEVNANSAYQPALGDGTGRVAFLAGTYADVPQAGDTMVEFSSWGPPPDLSFKPEITAPGGGIWSTVPGGYDNYSGTSMAAPYVGAAGALVKEAHPDWSPAQIKIALMNTAKILIEPATGRPYSVLKMGAGRVDVYNALHTDVLATDSSKGTSYIALGELPSYKTAPIVFTVRLTNSGTSSVSYTISSTIQTTNFNMTSRALTGATYSTIPSGSVTVPAGGTQDVVVMVDATAVVDWTGWPFVEGFVKFTPSSGVELHTPYFGILGKWNQFTNENGWDFNPLIDPPADNPINFSHDTWPKLTDFSSWYYAGVDFYGNFDRNAIAFNPSYCWLEADFWALRNMQNVTIEIRDQSDNLVKTIDSTDYIYKMIPSYGFGAYYYDPWDYDWWGWNGTDSLGNPAPDGYYKLVIKGTPPKIFNKLTYDAPQIIEFPVSLDTVAPSVTITSIVDNGNGTHTISWSSASDPAPSSGIWGYYVWVEGDTSYWLPPTQNSLTVSGLGYGDHEVYVGVYDNAWNWGEDDVYYDIYKITSSATSGGTISPLGEVLVGEGVNQSFVITANPNYHIADILVDGGSIFIDGRVLTPDCASYTYTFEDVQSDHTIHAVFASGILQYVITASAGLGGTISPSGDVLVEQFGSQSFTITPDPNFYIFDVLVDGSSVGAVSEYTFENVSDNHTIEAYFTRFTGDLIGVYRPSEYCFYLRNTDGSVQTIYFGLPTGDQPIIGDWD